MPIMLPCTRDGLSPISCFEFTVASLSENVFGRAANGRVVFDQQNGFVRSGWRELGLHSFQRGFADNPRQQNFELRSSPYFAINLDHSAKLLHEVVDRREP